MLLKTYRYILSHDAPADRFVFGQTAAGKGGTMVSQAMGLRHVQLRRAALFISSGMPRVVHKIAFR